MTPAEQCAALILDTWGPATGMHTRYRGEFDPYVRYQVGDVVMQHGDTFLAAEEKPWSLTVGYTWEALRP